MKRRRRRAALLTPNNVALVGLCLSTLWLLSRIISERRHSRAISLPVEDSDEEPGDDEPSEEAEAQVWNGKVGLKVRKRKLDDNNKRRPQKYKVLDERRIRHNANIPLPPLEDLPIFVENKIKHSEIFVHQGNYAKQLSQYEQVQGKKEFLRNLAAFPPANYSLSMYNFTNCAVVGSSGSLLNATFGSVIDTYDIVLRINQAPANKKFHSLRFTNMTLKLLAVRRVGSKTTMRLINTRWTNKYGDVRFIEGTKEGLGSVGERLPLEPGVTLISTRAKPRAYNAMVDFLGAARKDVRNFYLSSRVVSQARRLLVGYRTRLDGAGRGPYQGGSTPSSGYLGVYMLLQMCKKVSGFGFGLDAENGSPQQYHYFHLYTEGEKKNSMNPTHSFDAERDLLRALGDQGYMQLCNYIPHDRKHNKYCGALKAQIKRCSLRVRVGTGESSTASNSTTITRIRIPCNLTADERHRVVKQYEGGGGEAGSPVGEDAE